VRFADQPDALPPSGAPSAPPRSAAGTRARGGNAMARTRVAVLAGALRSVETSGSRRTTMADVAVQGGVAKATVYNHFRTKTDVYAALVESEVVTLGRECAQRAEQAAARPGARDGLAEAVEHAAVRLSEHGALRRLASDEPEVLARLLQPDGGPAWQEARAAVGRVLEVTGREPSAPSVDAVLRAVASHLSWPAERSAAALLADVLASGLPVPGSGAGAPDSADARDSGGAPEPRATGQRGAAGERGTSAEATAPARPSADPGRPSGEEPRETGLGWPG
jgi:AcrR family transcriptional regulator